MMRKLRSIRVQLTLWYIVLLGLTLLIFSGYLLLQMRDNLLAGMDSNLQGAAVGALALITLEDETPFFLDELRQAPEISDLGITLRLIKSDGTEHDSLGSRETLPQWAPQEAGFATLVLNEQSWRVYSRPVQLQGETVILWLQATQSLDNLYTTLEQMQLRVIWGVPLLLILTSVGGVFLADRALRPVERIRRTAANIRIDQLARRVGDTGTGDELGQLAHTFDSMLARLQTAFEVQRRFVADASHELRTPLTVVKGHIDVGLGRERDHQEYQRILEDIRLENERLITLVNRLLFLARLDAAQISHQHEAVELNDLLSLVYEQMQPLAASKNQTMLLELGPLPTIQGNTDHLIRLFLNLLDNAVKYTPENGEIKIQGVTSGREIVITISDNGIGISPEHQHQIFTRFYRVYGEETTGTGLGLAIAAQIAQEHSTNLTVTSELGKGSQFTIRFPIPSGATMSC